MALEPDRDVAQADGPMPAVQQRAGHDADRVGEVDDPCTGRRVLARTLRDVEDDGYRSQRFGEATGARRLLADATAFEWPALVAMAGRLPANPQLQDDRAGGVDPRIEVGGPRNLGGVVVGGHDALRDAADEFETVR